MSVKNDTYIFYRSPLPSLQEQEDVDNINPYENHAVIEKAKEEMMYQKSGQEGQQNGRKNSILKNTNKMDEKSKTESVRKRHSFLTSRSKSMVEVPNKR